MKSVVSICFALLAVASLTSVQAFAPRAITESTRAQRMAFYGFLGDKERDSLTRDSEPEEFFSTNTDKMSDKEKIPIAIAGVAFITIPFIAGLIALYSAK